MKTFSTQSIDISPDSTMILCCCWGWEWYYPSMKTNDIVRVFDVSTGKCTHIIKSPTAFFSSDSKGVYVGNALYNLAPSNPIEISLAKQPTLRVSTAGSGRLQFLLPEHIATAKLKIFQKMVDVFALHHWKDQCRRALQNVPGLGTSKCTTPFRERYTIPRLVCSLKVCNFSLLSG